MAKKKYIPPKEHFARHLGKVRQWIDGFEAAGKRGPACKDTLRQIEVWMEGLPHD